MGIDRRETITIPPLPDIDQWESFVATRRAMLVPPQNLIRRCHAILSSRENPKICGIDDAEVVGDLVTVDMPVPRHLLAQKNYYRPSEILEPSVAFVVGAVPVHPTLPTDAIMLFDGCNMLIALRRTTRTRNRRRPRWNDDVSLRNDPIAPFNLAIPPGGVRRPTCPCVLGL